MSNIDQQIKRIKVDCLYGKKKQFNAADRQEGYHYWLGLPLTIINIVTGTVLFYLYTDGNKSPLKALPILLAFVAALLSGFQTYFNFNKKVEGHRRIGNRYLAIYKKCDRLQAYIAEGHVDPQNVVDRIESIATEVDEINKEAEQFPTSKGDYSKAQKGIEGGEEDYTERELGL